MGHLGAYRELSMWFWRMKEIQSGYIHLEVLSI